MVNLVPRFVIVTSMLRHLVFSQLVRFKRLCKLLFSFFTMPKKTMKATKAMKAMKATQAGKAKANKTAVKAARMYPAFKGAKRLRRAVKAELGDYKVALYACCKLCSKSFVYISSRHLYFKQSFCFFRVAPNSQASSL